MRGLNRAPEQERVFADPLPVAPPPPIADEALLTSRHVRAWLGDISESSLWRWRSDAAFPPPMRRLLTRHFWQAGTVRAWLRTRRSAEYPQLTTGDHTRSAAS